MKKYNSKIEVNPLPTWYWEKGLHDAQIIDIQFYDLDYDFRCAKPLRNYALISIDASHALYDTSVCAIKLYNYKIVSRSDDLIGSWWKCEDLSMENEKYRLDITLSDARSEKHFVVKFDDCEIVRVY